MTDQKKSWFSTILTSIITSLAVLAGSWFAFQGDTDNADASRLESAFKRIEYLETEMRQQQANSNAKIIELTSQVFRLQSQLNKDLDIVDMFENFMDNLPFEAWIKEVTYDKEGDPVFKMISINKRYEFAHEITKQRYSGSLDAEVWGDEVAKEFRETDLKVLQTKSSVTVTEEYPDRPRSDNVSKKMIVKVYVELLEGRQMIFGMAIDYPEQQ